MIKSKSFLIALAGVALATPVQAQTLSEAYVRGSVGLSILSDSDNRGSVLNIESDFSNGPAVSGALGYQVSSLLRAEGEISYRKNDADGLTVTNPGTIAGLTADADGDISALSFMVNGYLDIQGVGPVPEDGPFVPYLMGGLGIARINADVSTAGVQLVDDDDTVFAYQVGAGAGYAVSEAVTLDLGYRYFSTRDPELTDSTGSDFDSEYNNHTVLAGVRYRF